MNEQIEQITEAPVKAKKTVKRAKPKRKAKAERPDMPVIGGQFAGVSASRCCDACTEKRCVISTVETCKHPYKTADSGCGPITMANRQKVRKLIKHQMIDAEKL